MMEHVLLWYDESSVNIENILRYLYIVVKQEFIVNRIGGVYLNMSSDIKVRNINIIIDDNSYNGASKW